MKSILQESSSILIIKPTSLGDVVQSLVCVCAIRKAYPKVKITFLVADFYCEMLVNHPDIEEVIPFPVSTMRKGIGGILKARKDLRRMLSSHSFDISLDLQGLARSAIAGRYSKAEVRAGFSDSREFATFFYTHKIQSNRMKVNSISRYLAAAEFLGARTSIKEATFNLHASKSALSEMSNRLKVGFYCSIFPGARWETKKWPLENYIAVAKLLVEKFEVKILVGGSNAESELGDAIVDALPKDSSINLAGSTNLQDMLAAIELSKLVITNDSGPMHVAAAMSIPTASIFGPTSIERIAPFGQEEWAIQSDISCKGCYKRKCHTMPPPCMVDVKPERVISVCERILQKHYPEVFLIGSS